MWDFSIFHAAAVCWLNGIDPYTCIGFQYPLPTLFLFLPLAFLPLPVAKGVWLLIELICLVVVCKRWSVWYALFVPVLQSLWLGQIDLIMLPAMAVATGPAMALLTLKPQLVWLYLPFWLWSAGWRDRLSFGVVAGFLWGGSTLAYPGWVQGFTESTRELGQAAYASPTLFGGGFLPVWLIVLGFLVGMAVFSSRRWVVSFLFNPALNSYNLAGLLVWRRWWLVPASWGTQLLANQVGAAWPHLLLTVMCL